MTRHGLKENWVARLEPGDKVLHEAPGDLFTPHFATVSGKALLGPLGYRVPLRVWWWPFTFFAYSWDLAGPPDKVSPRDNG